MGASCCEVSALVKVEGCFLQRETSGRSLKLELGNGPERGVGWREVEAYHGETGLGALRSGSAVRKQTSVHTFGGDGVTEDETGAVVGNLEDWPGHFYKQKGERHQSEMMAFLMGAYGVQRLVIRN